MTTPSEIVEVFDGAAATYDSVGVDFFTPIGAALVAEAGPAPGERVLDVGCGRGAVLFAAAEAVGPGGSVTGIDLAPAMVARTAAAAADMPNVTVEMGDAQAPAYPDESFDVVTAGLVLFFLDSPGAALVAYRRLLRPGGRLAFSSFASYDPRYPQAMKILARHADKPPAQRPVDEMFGSADRLRAAVEAAGFAHSTVRDAEVRSTFTDAAHLVKWIGSHGGRQLISRVPPERLDAATAAIAAEVTGPLIFTTRFRLTVAHG
jgi:ubiquinone/menaquinone biosynthesis C-methylase UbiE